ncbi:MAG: carboxypeptidase-like regulatory domain-containing protein [Pirellulales bacterium]
MRTFRTMLVSWAVLGLLLPEAAMAVEKPSKSAVVDVALRDGGVLVGQVVDPQGAAVAGAPVSLRYQDKNVVTATTSPEGYFAVKGLRGGVYQVAAADGQGVYRLWTQGTAPPSAQPGAMLVSGGKVVRGQNGGAIRTFFTNPFVIAGIVATAVAVPVALHNSHRHAPVSP